MLTDEELMLLEHLEYLDSQVEYVADVTLGDWENRTVGEILASFDEEACRWLSEKGDELVGPLVSGREWTALLTAIRENRHLSSLRCLGQNENVFATAYCDPEGNAFVTFRGTTGGHEWYDDVDGLHGADTVCQEEAFNYIESLPFDKITVVGHSKGGNKAQYVAVVSDKVEYCVSMDGQGFSVEFIDKYADRIRTRAGRIRNYSLANDYVHILLYPVPGAQQIYCKGGPLHVGYLAHSPAGFFRYEHVVIQDRALKEEDLEALSGIDGIEESSEGENFSEEGKQSGLYFIEEAPDGENFSDEGKDSDIAFVGQASATEKPKTAARPAPGLGTASLKLLLNEDGLPEIQRTEENAGMHYLHRFTCFALATMRDNMKERMITYLGNVLALSMSEDYEVKTDSEVYNHASLASYIFSDQRTAAFFLAFLFKYVDTYQISEGDFIALLGALGVKGFYEEVRGEMGDKKKTNAYHSGISLLSFLLKQLKDGRVDPILEDIFEKSLRRWMRKSSQEEALAGKADVRQLWRDTERAFLKIKVQNPEEAAEDIRL